MHDGSTVRLRKVAEDYDPTDRDRAYAYIRERQARRRGGDRAAVSSRPTRATCTIRATPSPTPLTQLPYEELCPGSAELDKLQGRFR